VLLCYDGAGFPSPRPGGMADSPHRPTASMFRFCFAALPGMPMPSNRSTRSTRFTVSLSVRLVYIVTAAHASRLQGFMGIKLNN
jgi:hypothetical protein